MKTVELNQIKGVRSMFGATLFLKRRSLPCSPHLLGMIERYPRYNPRRIPHEFRVFMFKMEFAGDISYLRNSHFMRLYVNGTPHEIISKIHDIKMLRISSSLCRHRNFILISTSLITYRNYMATDSTKETEKATEDKHCINQVKGILDYIEEHVSDLTVPIKHRAEVVKMVSDSVVRMSAVLVTHADLLRTNPN